MRTRRSRHISTKPFSPTDPWKDSKRGVAWPPDDRPADPGRDVADPRLVARTPGTDLDPPARDGPPVAGARAHRCRSGPGIVPAGAPADRLSADRDTGVSVHPRRPRAGAGVARMAGYDRAERARLRGLSGRGGLHGAADRGRTATDPLDRGSTGGGRPVLTGLHADGLHALRRGTAPTTVPVRSPSLRADG